MSRIVFVCRTCKKLFEKKNKTYECPHCGSLKTRPASNKELKDGKYTH